MSKRFQSNNNSLNTPLKIHLRGSSPKRTKTSLVPSLESNTESVLPDTSSFAQDIKTNNLSNSTFINQAIHMFVKQSSNSEPVESAIQEFLNTHSTPDTVTNRQSPIDLALQTFIDEHLLNQENSEIITLKPIDCAIQQFLNLNLNEQPASIKTLTPIDAALQNFLIDYADDIKTESPATIVPAKEEKDEINPKVEQKMSDIEKVIFDANINLPSKIKSELMECIMKKMYDLLVTKLGNIKIILDCDINGSIVCFDTVDSYTPQQAVIEIMTKHLYGTVQNCEWIPNPNPFEESGMSYYKFITSQHKDYKPLLQKFSENKYFVVFNELFTSMCSAYNETFFESFNMILKLCPNIKIVFRTFGNDGNKVETLLGKELVWFSHDSVNKVMVKEDGKVCTLEQFGEFLYSTDEYVIVQEDYPEWVKHNKSIDHAKQVTEIKGAIRIAVDDNPCMNLVGENVYFHKINTCEVMFDPYYFVKRIIMSLNEHVSKDS